MRHVVVVTQSIKVYAQATSASCHDYATKEKKNPSAQFINDKCWEVRKCYTDWAYNDGWDIIAERTASIL